MQRTTTISTLSEMLEYTISQRKVNQKTAALAMGMSTATISRLIELNRYSRKWVMPIAIWCSLTPRELWDLLNQERASL